MENRLCLNSVPTFDLPSEIEVVEIIRSINRYRVPDIKPNIRLNVFGKPFKVLDADKQRSNEVWFITENKELLDFISTYDWDTAQPATSGGSAGLKIWKIKKIIKEEFYNGK